MTLPTSGPLTLADIQTEFGGSNPIAMNEYYAGGTYVAAGTSGTYGAVPSSGQISVQNFYGTSAVIPVYIEEVFSTYLYTGNGGTQTITNGIDLSTNNGMVWIKNRVTNNNHILQHTPGYGFNSNTTTSYQSLSSVPSAWTTTGFTNTYGGGENNSSGETYVSWTFRKQPKFFDVVTYTGDGTEPRNISHNLGSVPGCMIVRATSTAGGWRTYHRSLGATQYVQLQSTNAAQTYPVFYDTAPTSTVFTVGTDINASGVAYVAYLFAHNAGGFGATGTDNVITCGGVTLDGSGQGNVTLGYEPQWILYKRTDGAGNWNLVDSTRGWWATPNQSGATLFANGNFYEAQLGGQGSPASYPNATGFLISGSGGQSFIYVAIRRGPMKVPTVGTTVFSPQISDSGTTGQQITTNFPVDMQISGYNGGSIANFVTVDRLRGVSSNSTEQKEYLLTTSTAATGTTYNVSNNWNNTGYGIPTIWAGGGQRYWNFRRAPSFFDMVCYTGTGVARTVTHSLAAVPEMMIVKGRANTGNWITYVYPLTASNFISLNTTNASSGLSIWNDTTPTASVFSLGTSGAVNGSGLDYVAYLFATCAGVSKVGSYTGNGTTQTINCSFTTGARFVLIKRTDDLGDWYTYDTARGMTVLTDPYLRLNSTGAEVATLGSVTTVSTGFALNAAILAAINTNGASYIFLAIA